MKQAYISITELYSFYGTVHDFNSFSNKLSNDKINKILVFPQFSSFPSAFPPRGDQFGQIMFDSTQYTRYQETVRQHLDESRRKKRSPRRGGTLITPPLGIAMPCQVQNFNVSYLANTKKLIPEKKFYYVVTFDKINFNISSVIAIGKYCSCNRYTEKAELLDSVKWLPNLSN